MKPPRALMVVCAAELPLVGAWIEISSQYGQRGNISSLPVRGAWIEIRRKKLLLLRYSVAPRAGSVD